LPSQTESSPFGAFSAHLPHLQQATRILPESPTHAIRRSCPSSALLSNCLAMPPIALMHATASQCACLVFFLRRQA
jgi:hypothetical protein